MEYHFVLFLHHIINHHCCLWRPVLRWALAVRRTPCAAIVFITVETLPTITERSEQPTIISKTLEQYVCNRAYGC